MKTKVKLKIADIIIEMQSRFALEPFTEEEQKQGFAERLLKGLLS